MPGAFQVKFSHLDVSRHIKRDSLKELTVQAEGPLMWDFMVDSISIEAGRRIFKALGIAEGEVDSFRKRIVDIYYYGDRKFAGWVNKAVWDEKRRNLTLEIDSVGMVVKDLLAGVTPVFSAPAPYTFKSVYMTGGGFQILVPNPILFHNSMTVNQALQTLTNNINRWLSDKGYLRHLGPPSVDVRDFKENYTVENGDSYESGSYEVVSIRKESGSHYLITRKVDSTGYWAYYRTLIGGSGLTGSTVFIGYYTPGPLHHLKIQSDPFTTSFTIIDTSQGNAQVGSYQKDGSWPPLELPEAVKEYLVGLYSVDDSWFRDFIPKGSYWFTIGRDSGGERVFMSAQIVNADKYTFEYDETATVGEVLHDLAVMTDGMIGFDYSGTSSVKVFIQNREIGDSVNTTGLLDLNRESAKQTDQEFSTPDAFTLLDTVQTGIDEYYLDVLNRESKNIETLVHRSQFEALSTIIPGKRLNDISFGDLGQINSITYGETTVSISSRKRANA